MSQNLPPFDLNNLHNKSDADKTKPRPPKPETEARLLHGIGAQAAPSQNTKSQSTLSVNAPEFTPMAYQFASTPASFSQPPPSLSVGAAEFVPRTDFVPVPMAMPCNVGPPLQMPPPHIPPPSMPVMPPEQAMLNSFSQLSVQGGGGGESGLVDHFTQTMVMLTMHPANIRDFLKPLCAKLRQAQSPATLENVICILYEQSIYQPNFSYTGARVVHFMCGELKDHPIFGQFKMSFLQRCQQDFNRREQLIKSGDEGMNTLRGLTLFMGELFLNVTLDSSGQTERLQFLPTALTDLVMTLLSHPSDLSVKTACQLLKMAGGPTEDAMCQKEAHEQQNFNSIFSCLHNLQNSPHISQNMKILMKSVLDLRQNNWGRVQSRAPNLPEHSQENHTSPADFSQSEPVFYDVHGKRITREEAGYQEEEEDDGYDPYELTEEEEAEFLIWQEENSRHKQMGGEPGGGLENGMGRPPYPDGGGYQQWSTGDGSNYMYSDYSQNYDYNSYPPYLEEEGLSDEMEKAYEEFLSSQRGPPGPSGR